MEDVLASVYTETRDKMKKSIDTLNNELAHIRTGKASAALFDNITVDYYGSTLPINQVATLSFPEARLVIIQPWDKTMISKIEKAIGASNLGLNPQNDGTIIRVPIPALSEQRRKELVKTCKKMSEESKISIRNIRRNSNEKIKQAKNDKTITEDDEKKAYDKIQDITNSFIEDVDTQIAHKEEEIMQV
jgi:ribosome recycling factor